MPPYKGNPLDESVNTELMRVCKCVIPYLEKDVQRNVAVGLKFLELINTINTFSDTSNLASQFSLTRQGNWQEDLLRNVKSSLSPEKAYLIDAFIKLQECKSILNIKDSFFPFNAQSLGIFSPDFASTPTSAPTSTLPDEPPTTITHPSESPTFFPFDEGSTYTRPEDETYFEPDPPPLSSKPGTGPSPSNLIQALSPMLDDNQKQMLSLLSAFMNTK